jgi:hypothetical protein
MQRTLLLGAAAAVLVTFWAARPSVSQETKDSKTIPADQLTFFEKKIRPVLVRECYTCHSNQAEKLKGKLLLDSRDGIRRGGASGPAVVPGNVKDSLLIDAIKYADETLKMPPAHKLSDAVIADFEQWVKMGAPDPRDTGAPKVAWKEIDIEKGKEFWSFQLPKKVAPPAVKNANWAKGPIDQFLLAAMEAKGLEPVGDADRLVLLRRLHLDLTGLPPSPEDVKAFLADETPEAVAKVVDKLLDSPAFGERWGRHWLDVARFGETSGKQVNFNYPYAWRYRDWVISAFNADMPYTQFIKEQIAGDLLPAADAKAKIRQQIATGFLAIGPKDHDERNRTQFVLDLVDEQIDVTSQAFLGLTISCARCHDHKFDPIPQKDYYALAGIFKSTQPLYGTIRIIQNNHPSELISIPAETGQTYYGDKLTPAQKENLTKQLDKLKDDRKELQKDPQAFQKNLNQLIFYGIRISTLEGQLNSYDSEGNPKQLAMGVREATAGGGFGGGPGGPKGGPGGFGGPGFVMGDCPLYERGEVAKPGTKVARSLPRVLTSKQPKIAKGSGRKELAEWLASADNPLTARVMVNRVWSHLFGRGLVPTPDNFGSSGLAPSHPELLDYLAVTFQEDGWSVKKLIRRLVLTRAYQLAGKTNARNQEVDPDNVYLWRATKRRLDAEAVRDSILAISGKLDATPYKGSVVARGGEGYSGGFGGGGPGKGGADQTFMHRSVYMPIVRNGLPDVLALFDFPDPSMVCGQRATTTVPAQALFFLNNPWVVKQAENTADRLLAQKLPERELLDSAYVLVYGRSATEKELDGAEGFLRNYAKSTGAGATPTATQRRAGVAAFCQALFASAEFQHRN